MPCYTITTVQVEWAHVKTDILKRALETMGHRVTETANGLSWNYGRSSFVNGRLTVSSESEVTSIKRAYGTETVKTQAKRFGWRIRELKDGQFEVTK